MLNRWTGLGRITSNPKEKEISTRNGKKAKVVNYTVAIDRNFKNSKGQRDADFVRCTAWGASANYLSKYVKKGNLIYNDGVLRTRRVQSKNNPNHYRYFSGIHIEFVGLAGSNRPVKKSENNNEKSTNAPIIPNSKQNSDEKDIQKKKVRIIDDDLPF